MRLKLYKNGQMILDVTKRKKSQILLQLERISHDMGCIKVQYENGCNESAHISDDSLKNALSAYLEKHTLEFCQGKKGGSDGI